jgi:hypothetical protein
MAAKVAEGNDMQIRLKEMLHTIMQGAKQAANNFESAAAAADSKNAETGATNTGFFGGAAALNEYFFPAELTGGVCPRVIGQEREIAWHAAAEACDTERVHMVWSVADDKVWYLAARSSDFASHTHTWCPFVSLLPGKNDAKDTPICYTYYSDEAAVMMTVTADSLQIHRGTTAVVRAKAERMARELGIANTIALDPDVIMKLAPVGWHSVSLFEDRVRRILTMLVVFAGLAFASIAFFIWLFASLGIMQQHRQLDDIQQRTQQKTMELMEGVERMRASVLREQVAKFAELNEGLVQVGGWMKFYQIKQNKVRWRATVPPSVTGEKIREFGAKLLTTSDQGISIGTDTDPVVKR